MATVLIALLEHTCTKHEYTKYLPGISLMAATNFTINIQVGRTHFKIDATRYCHTRSHIATMHMHLFQTTTDYFTLTTVLNQSLFAVFYFRYEALKVNKL